MGSTEGILHKYFLLNYHDDKAGIKTTSKNDQSTVTTKQCCIAKSDQQQLRCLREISFDGRISTLFWKEMFL